MRPLLLMVMFVIYAIITQKEIIDGQSRKTQLDKIINFYKGQNNDYDCIVPLVEVKIVLDRILS